MVFQSHTDQNWELPEPIGSDSGDRLWAVDGALTTTKPTAAGRLPGRYSTPGLVDAHFHVAFRYGAVPVGLDDALNQLRAARDQGVLLVRDLGAHDRLSLDLPPDPSLPRVIASGQHIAVEGGFVEGSHQPVPPGQLVTAALRELDAGATWVKVITDGQPGETAYPLVVIRQMVDAVHARGFRVAAHAERTGRQILETGVDSIEHGFTLDEQDLRLMADRGVGWSPTTNLLVRDLREADGRLAAQDLTPDRRSDWRSGANRCSVNSKE